MGKLTELHGDKLGLFDIMLYLYGAEGNCGDG